MLDLTKKEKSFFDEFFAPLRTPRNTTMKTDIKEVDDNYILEIELPGFNKEDIKVTLEREYLVITASKTEEKEEKKDNYIRQERYAGSVSRSYYVGDIKLEDLKGNYQNGVLKITIPKEQTKTEEKVLTIE